MKPTTRSPLVTAAILAVALALGCGDDKKSSQPEDDFIIDIADGTWREVTTVEWGEADESCDFLRELITGGDTTFVQCELDVRDLGDAGEDCEITVDGGSVTIDCATAQVTGPCITMVTVEGTAQVEETSYTSNITITLKVIGDAQTCGSLMCTGTVHVTGTWVSAEGDCPPAAPARRQFGLRAPGGLR